MRPKESHPAEEDADELGTPAHGKATRSIDSYENVVRTTCSSATSAVAAISRMIDGSFTPTGVILKGNDKHNIEFNASD